MLSRLIVVPCRRVVTYLPRQFTPQEMKRLRDEEAHATKRKEEVARAEAMLKVKSDFAKSVTLWGDKRTAFRVSVYGVSPEVVHEIQCELAELGWVSRVWDSHLKVASKEPTSWGDLKLDD